MRISVGIDVAKEVHWACAIDDGGRVLLDRAVANDPLDMEQLAVELRALDGERRIGVDITGGVAALLCAVLRDAGEALVYVPGIAVNRARQGTQGGEHKSDPGDARVIADQVRVREGLRPLLADDEVLAELRLFVARRRDLVADQTRRLNRLHELLLSIHPGLERRLTLKRQGTLTLLGRYVTPAEIRAAGKARIERYLKAAGVRGSAKLAEAAHAAAVAQTTVLPGEQRAAVFCRELATEALAAMRHVDSLDDELAELVARHPNGTLVRSLPGMGVTMTSECLVEVGDIRRFPSAAALASASGLAPVLRQSGKMRFVRRPLGGNKSLKRVFYQSAFCALKDDPTSRAFYDRKRREGKRHHQALIALARRRIDVLWAILRDRRPYDGAHARPEVIAA